MAKPCSVCGSDKRGSIENAIRRGRSDAWVANTYKVAVGSVRGHREGHMGVERHPEPEPPEPPAPGRLIAVTRLGDPVLAGGLAAPNSLAIAEENVRMLHGELKRLQGADDADAKIVAAVANALTSANRMLARLTSAHELTETIVARSAPFKRLLDVMIGALEAFPGAGEAVEAALRKALGEKVPET